MYIYSGLVGFFVCHENKLVMADKRYQKQKYSITCLKLEPAMYIE